MGAEQMTLMIWETSVTSHGNNSAVIARKPVFAMTTTQAAKVLRCSAWTVAKLYRNGILSGYKPGAVAKRCDGRKSNARIMLDSESVLRYKQSCHVEGVF
jgi:excisionase family DNA binding protein